jgi:uncharacterized phage protein (TIGR02216 family)
MSPAPGAWPNAWPGLLRLAAERFAVTPQAFWRLSLVEWRALTAPVPQAQPLDRAGLDALLAAFPDDPPASEIR